MTSETQSIAQQSTEEQFKDMVNRLAKDGEAIMAQMTPWKAHIDHMAKGMAGEAGEVVDCIKRHTVYNKELDVKNLQEELGDTLFFMQGIMREFGWSFTDLMEANMRKLDKRYASGTYSDEQAQNRADKQDGE